MESLFQGRRKNDAAGMKNPLFFAEK